MKYVIDKKGNNSKLANYNVKLDGDGELKEEYIRKRLSKKIDKIINFMLRILNEDDTGEDDAGMVLDELNRLKGIMINKYRKDMKESEYKSMLAKIILIEDEFKRSYNEKIYMNYGSNNYCEEEYVSGRGR